jgi:protein-tyrosine-phosphatase/predicted ATP-grasp superfamily ATP-dependent carboligase
MAMRAKPVLILGAEPRVAVTIARSLDAHGIPVYVAALSPEERPLRSRALSGFFRLPPPLYAPELFAESLIEAVRRHDFDMVIPSNDGALSGLAEGYEMLRNRLNGQVHLGCPPPDVVNRVLDKSATLEAARQCGIAVPQTWEIERGRLLEREPLSEIASTLRFPAIVKPRSKAQAAHLKVRRFQSLQELRRATAKDRALGTGMLIQEYCPGVGVGIEVLMEQQAPRAMFQHRRLKELPASGGVSVLAVSEAVDPHLAEAALCLLRHLRWNGVAMVEFRQDESSGRAVLMEVNGRYWGSLPLSRLAGLEFPYYEWQLAHGQQLGVPAQYRIGVRARWTAGTLLRAKELLQDRSRPRWPTLVQTVKDLLPPTRDAIWSFRDPLPALDELRRTAGVLLRNAVKAGLWLVLPTRLVEAVRHYRILGPRDGRVYLRGTLLRLAGLRRDTWEGFPPGSKSILFVCHGNIIRSPMAAAMLTRALVGTIRGISVASAGLHAKPYGQADARALALAQQFGCSLQSHQAQMISKDMVERADAIFVMDRLNEAKLLGRFPQAKGKVWLLGAGEAGGERGEIDIVDPYDGGTEDVRRCYERLAGCVQRLADVLSSTTSSGPASRPGKSGDPSVGELATQRSDRQADVGRIAVHD